MCEDRSPRIYKVLIMILPVGVVIGTIVFMWMYFAKHQEESNEQNVIVATGIRISDLEDMVRKFTVLIGLRTSETEEGRIGLRQAAATIEGRLGPKNLGLMVRKDSGEAAHELLFKSLWVDIRGQERAKEIVFMAVSYAGEGEVADSNTVATVMMLASSLANEKPSRTIRFVFLPFDRSPADQKSWLRERCLSDDESCVAIIGLKTMQQAPQISADSWQMVNTDSKAKLWWESVKMGGVLDTDMPNVWITHPVYAADAWHNKKDERLKATIGVTQEIRGWLYTVAR